MIINNSILSRSTLGAICLAMGSFFGGFGPLFAQEPVAAAANAQAPVAVVYTPKRQSEFKPAQAERNPFWPIGWKPAKAIANNQAVAPATNIPPSFFKLSSILTGNPAIAVIDNRDYMVGQAFTKDYEGKQVRFVIQAIRDGVVVLSYPGGLVTLRN